MADTEGPERSGGADDTAARLLDEDPVATVDEADADAAADTTGDAVMRLHLEAVAEPDPAGAAGQPARTPPLRRRARRASAETDSDDERGDLAADVAAASQKADGEADDEPSPFVSRSAEAADVFLGLPDAHPPSPLFSPVALPVRPAATKGEDDAEDDAAAPAPGPEGAKGPAASPADGGDASPPRKAAPPSPPQPPKPGTQATASAATARPVASATDGGDGGDESETEGEASGGDDDDARFWSDLSRLPVPGPPTPFEVLLDQPAGKDRDTWLSQAEVDRLVASLGTLDIRGRPSLADVAEPAAPSDAS